MRIRGWLPKLPISLALYGVLFGLGQLLDLVGVTGYLLIGVGHSISWWNFSRTAPFTSDIAASPAAENV